MIGAHFLFLIEILGDDLLNYDGCNFSWYTDNILQFALLENSCIFLGFYGYNFNSSSKHNDPFSFFLLTEKESSLISGNMNFNLPNCLILGCCSCETVSNIYFLSFSRLFLCLEGLECPESRSFCSPCCG